jgi:tetratricopeptide (TPR) repeat protein
VTDNAAERERVAAEVRGLVEQGDRDGAADLLATHWRLWLVSGEVTEGRRLLAEVLDSGEPQQTRARALALYADGVLAFRQGSQEESRERNEAALEVARAAGDREAAALALVGLARVAFREGDYDRVRALAASARDLTQDLDPAAGAAPLHLLAAGTRLAGDYDEAVRLYTESLELNRGLGDKRVVAMEHHNLGHVELHRGNADAAAQHFAEADELRDPGDPYDRAMAALNRAALAVTGGERDRTDELLREVEATLAEAGITLDPDDAYEVDWLRARLSA